MWNKIPVLGWFISIVACVSMALPFWIAWTKCGIGETYFYFLPEVYRVIPFWDTVGIFLCIPIVAHLIQKFVPVLVKIDNSSKSDSGDS